MLNIPKNPEELSKYTKVAVFDLFGRSPKWLRAAFYHGIFGSVPSYEIDGITEKARAETLAGHGRKLFTIYVATVLFVFGGSLVFSWISGTLLGPVSTTRVYFLRDYHNIILYVLIVPLYVAVGFMLIYSFFISKNEIKQLMSALDPTPSAIRPPWATIALTARSCISFAAIVLLSVLLTANYVKDLTDSRRTDMLYWFFDEASGVRSINMAGSYYIILNFLLLTLTFFCTFAFIAGARMVINAANGLRQATGRTTVYVKEIGTYFDGFCWLYGYAKIMIVLYSLNLYIWQRSPAGNVQNFDIALVLLFVVGVFVISFPRQHLELSWYRYRLANRLVEQGKEQDISEVEDIRPRRILWTAWICNILITFILVKELMQNRISEWIGDSLSKDTLSRLGEWFSSFVDWVLSGPS